MRKCLLIVCLLFIGYLALHARKWDHECEFQGEGPVDRIEVCFNITTEPCKTRKFEAVHHFHDGKIQHSTEADWGEIDLDSRGCCPPA